jgi:hypothetical protein
MFLLFEAAGENLVFGFITEPLEVLIFGVGLVLLTVGLRAIFKRAEKSTDSKVIHRTK